VKFLADDRNQDVASNGDPELGLEGVVARAEEVFDPPGLLDPLEEQFDSPA